MIEKLQQAFIKQGYRKIQTSTAEVTGFYKEAGGQGYCVCLIDDRKGFLNVSGKKDYFIRQMGTFMQEKTNKVCQRLGIVLTDQVERTRAYTRGTESCWLVDAYSGKLLVYEDQPSEFLDARECIEGKSIPYGTGYYRSTEFLAKPVNRVRAFHLTPVNTCLVIINIVVFLLLEIIGDTESADFVYHWGGMTIRSVLDAHQYWRLLSSAFLHFGISHLFSNMLVLAFVGDNLERALGSVKYLVLYLLGAVGSGFLSCLWMFLRDEYNVVSAGASGAIFAVLGGIFYVLIKNHGRKDDLSTAKVGMFLVFSILQGLTSVSTNNSAHISGLLIGVVLATILYQRDNTATHSTDVSGME